MGGVASGFLLVLGSLGYSPSLQNASADHQYGWLFHSALSSLLGSGGQLLDSSTARQEVCPGGGPSSAATHHPLTRVSQECREGIVG